MKSLKRFGVSANELRIVGGGSKNPLWRQIIADSFQLPLRFPTEPESAALGGALQAAAVYNNASVADFILENEPPLADEVSSISPTTWLDLCLSSVIDLQSSCKDYYSFDITREAVYSPKCKVKSLAGQGSDTWQAELWIGSLLRINIPSTI